MALPAVAGNTIQASDLYQLARPSGGTETGKYLYVGSGSNGGSISAYTGSLSRGVTPVSVSIDTVDVLNTVTTPGTSRLTSNGFDVSSTFTANTSSAGAGGNYTIQY